MDQETYTGNDQQHNSTQLIYQEMRKVFKRRQRVIQSKYV
jgi:hypothetical protein